MGQKDPFAKQVVLVVEDDPLLRMFAVEMVEDAGFDVIEAGGADEAVDILEKRPDVSILFTDIDMPGTMNGVDLAHWACHSATPIQIVVTSGHHMLRDGDLPDGSVFFAKPYDAGVVTSTIRSMAA
jgi:CheY-like chemotaxis protein